jgi:hypothetical protein
MEILSDVFKVSLYAENGGRNTEKYNETGRNIPI